MVQERQVPNGYRARNWNGFTASVIKLNGFVRPRALRNYQSDILSSGQFNVVSPNSGEVVSVTRSERVGSYIAYPLPDGSGSWLIAGYVALGNPICGLAVPARKRTYALLKL